MEEGQQMYAVDENGQPIMQQQMYQDQNESPNVELTEE